jgi:hypothetical protein
MFKLTLISILKFSLQVIEYVFSLQFRGQVVYYWSGKTNSQHQQLPIKMLSS